MAATLHPSRTPRTHEKRSPPHRTFGCLSLEALEPRDVPATYVWSPPMLGSDYLSTTAGNWLLGTGPSMPASVAPGQYDHLYFIGGQSSADCTIPQPSITAPTNAFAGIHLIFGLEAVATPIGSPPVPPNPVPYSGTVTAAGSFAVGELEVDCGAIAQADPNAPTGTAGTLTVNASLDWTGGTLNSNSVAGTIALAPGATGLAAPSEAVDYSVSLGSTLALTSNTSGVGSTVEVMEGTFNLTLDAARFDVASDSLIAFRAPVPKPNVPPPPFAGNITINGVDKTDTAINKGDLVVEERGKAVVRAESRGTETGMAVVNFCAKTPKLANDGIVSIEDRSEIHFIACVALGGEGGGLISGKETNKAAVVMEPGCKLFCTGKTMILIDGGALQLADLPGTTLVETEQPKIVISGPSTETVLTIKPFCRLERVEGPKGRVTLEVSGKVYNQGQIELYASRVAERNDKITSTGQIEFDSGSVVRVQWFDENGQSRGLDSTWTVIETSYAGNGDPINDAYQLLQPTPHEDVHLTDVLSTDKKVFKVKRDEFPEE